MAYHESFWLATSAAAPVIALAAIVALPDASKAIDSASQTLRTYRQQHGSDRSPAARIVLIIARVVRWQSLLIWGLTLANVLAQAALLAVSLSALAYGHDPVPPPDVIALAVGGILILAWTVSSSASFGKRPSEKPSTPGAGTAADADPKSQPATSMQPQAEKPADHA